MNDEASSGISFGSNTHTHPDVDELSDKQLWFELVCSKQCLEKRLGANVQLLAYPHGYSNHDIPQTAEKAGYEAACGINRGRISRFDLCRKQYYTNDTRLSFVYRLTMWSYYFRYLREETSVGQFIRTMKHKIIR